VVEGSKWLTFSAILLVLAGIMRIFDAIWAFSYNGPLVDDLHGAIFGHSLTTYGWIWLIVGIILVGAGFNVMLSGTAVAQVARWIGIVAAGIAAVTSVAWLPYYPIWSLIYIGLAMAVIYGLVAHFSEAETTT
jgi:hypothetical protein